MLANEHWKVHRPRLYSELQRKGTLTKVLAETQESASDMMIRLIQRGMYEHEAWEIVSRQCIFLPDEEDMPNLGETPEE
jgi:hypothetical protein